MIRYTIRQWRWQDGSKIFFFLLLAHVLDVVWGFVTDFPWDIRILYYLENFLNESGFSKCLQVAWVVRFGSFS